jgi:hypothetical protein
MRTRWKIVGGVSLLGVGLVLALVTRRAEGQSSDPPGTWTSPDGYVPFEPYALGPGAIPFTQQTAAEQANLQAMHERLETAQPAASHTAFSSGARVMAQRFAAEVAARAVGLEGTGDDGVVP